MNGPCLGSNCRGRGGASLDLSRLLERPLRRLGGEQPFGAARGASGLQTLRSRPPGPLLLEPHAKHMLIKPN